MAIGIPVFDTSRIIEFLLNVAVNFIKWIAFRAFILSVIAVAVPVAIYHAWLLVQEKIFEYVNSMTVTDGVWQGTVIQFTGFSAWLADRLRFQECLTVIITVLIMKFALSFIKR